MIYICIPALNEARTVGVLLWKIRQVMEEFPRDYHVLVLDDGSTDDTQDVLEPYTRVLPVTVLRNERTQGYAAAVERLIRESARLATHPKRDVVVTMQADFTESPDDIPNLLKRVEGGADVVGAAVTSTEGELPRSLRWSRRGLPWLLSGAQLPKEVKDPLSGFRAYRVSVLKRALQDRNGKPLLTKHGWAANAELLLCVAPHVRRAEAAEVSLRYTRRERPTRFRPWNTAVELWDLARKAPRRLAEARAAAAAHPPEDTKPPRPQDEPKAQRPQDDGRPQRSQDDARAHRPQDEGRPQRQQGDARPQRAQGDAQHPRAHGDAKPQRPREEARRQRSPEDSRPQRSPDEARQQQSPDETRQPRVSGDGKPQRTREGGKPQGAPRPPKQPRPAPQDSAEALKSAEAQAPVESRQAGDEQQPPIVPDDRTSLEVLPGIEADAPVSAGAAEGEATRPKRKRPPRKRGSRKPAGDAVTPSADAAVVPATDEPSAEPAVPAENAADGEAQAAAPARKRSRPRRPRRPRAEPSSAGGDAGDSGSGEGGAADHIPERTDEVAFE